MVCQHPCSGDAVPGVCLQHPVYQVNELLGQLQHSRHASCWFLGKGGLECERTATSPHVRGIVRLAFTKLALALCGNVSRDHPPCTAWACSSRICCQSVATKQWV